MFEFIFFLLLSYFLNRGDDCNSLASQKEGVQGRKRRKIKEREAIQGLRRQAQTFPQVSLYQGCWIRGTGENVDGDKGFYSTGRAEGVKD